MPPTEVIHAGNSIWNTPKRQSLLLAALACSVLGHTLFVSATALGFSPFAILFNPKFDEVRPPIVARINIPPPAPPIVEPARETTRPPEPVISPTPVRKSKTPPSSNSQAQTLIAKDKEAAASRVPVESATQESPASQDIPGAPSAQAEIAAPSSSPAAAPSVPRAAKTSALPPQAEIEFEVTLESNNTKVWATQNWEMGGGRYSVRFNAVAKALFWTLGSLKLESRGVVDGDGLRPEIYSDERNQRKTVVTFSANEKSAYVEEHNGHKKTVAITGQAADIMSLTYDLAFNPDIALGSPFTLTNRDNVEELRLAEKRDEVIEGEFGRYNTRFFDFRRANGTGGMQVWLATDKNWLPAKIRILGRDGAITMLAIRFKMD